MTKRYFKGARGSVAASALEFCQVCGSQAAAHQRDVDGGRDRLICPKRNADGDIIARRTVDGDIMPTGEILATPWFDPADRPDRLERALDFAQKIVPQQPRMTIPDAVRASAKQQDMMNAIDRRMRQLKLTRDEQRELRRRAQLAQIEEERRAQIDEQGKLIALQAAELFSPTEVVYRPPDSAKEISGEVYYRILGRAAGMTGQAAAPAKPAKKEPSVAVAPSRAYFED